MNDRVVGLFREVILIVLHGAGVILFVDGGLRRIEKIVQGLRGGIGDVLSAGGLRGHSTESAEKDAQNETYQRTRVRSHADERFSPGVFTFAGETWFSWFVPFRAFKTRARYLPV